MFFHERLEEKSPGRVPVHFPSRWGNFMPAVIPGRPQLVADPNTSTARTWTVLEWETTRGPRGENWKNQQSTPEGSRGKPLKRAWRPPSSVSSTETALPSALGEPGGGAGGEGFASCKVDSKPGCAGPQATAREGAGWPVWWRVQAANVGFTREGQRDKALWVFTLSHQINMPAPPQHPTEPQE